MTISELIAQLQEMPQNAQVIIMDGEKGQCGDTRAPEPEQEWHDLAENYVVVL